MPGSAYTVLNLLLGILVVGVGFLIEPALWIALQAGPAQAGQALGAALANPSSIAVPALVAGSITAVVAMSGRSMMERMYRGAAACVLVLVVVDSFTMLMSGPELTTVRYLFSVASDLVGGILAGAVIGYLVDRLAAARA